MINDLGIVTGDDGYIPLCMPKMGRPRKSKDLLTHVVSAAFTQKDYEEMKEICKRDGIRISEVLRNSWLIAREQLL